MVDLFFYMQLVETLVHHVLCLILPFYHKMYQLLKEYDEIHLVSTLNLNKNIKIFNIININIRIIKLFFKYSINLPLIPGCKKKHNKYASSSNSINRQLKIAIQFCRNS